MSICRTTLTHAHVHQSVKYVFFFLLYYIISSQRSENIINDLPIWFLNKYWIKLQLYSQIFAWIMIPSFGMVSLSMYLYYRWYLSIYIYYINLFQSVIAKYKLLDWKHIRWNLCITDTSGLRNSSGIWKCPLFRGE